MRFNALIISLAVGLAAGIAVTALIGSRGATRVDVSRPSVIKQMREMGRLETAAYSVEKIVEAGKESRGSLTDLLFGDKLLLVAHGEVVAGVDLSELDSDSVTIKGDRVEVSLPAPTVFSVRLDNSKTSVYDRSQGLLSRSDKDLESEARVAAESAIRKAACEGGILSSAKASASRQVRAFFGAIGYEDVRISVSDGEGC